MHCKLLNISEAANIAIHSVRHLAADGGCVSGSRISEALGVSNHHLAKVMRKLVVAGIVSVEKGPHGGFYLNDSQRGVTLMTIYECVDGEQNFGECLMDEPLCGNGQCIFGSLLKNLRREFEKSFNNTRISDCDFLKPKKQH